LKDRTQGQRRRPTQLVLGFGNNNISPVAAFTQSCATNSLLDAVLFTRKIWKIRFDATAVIHNAPKMA
jgi:hypothetical protein